MLKSLMAIILVVTVGLFSSGCASLSGSVVEKGFDEAGHATETITAASIAKEEAVHKSLQIESEGYYKSLPKTGAKMGIISYQEIELATGQTIFLPLMEASFVEAPKRNLNLPTAPSNHPVWGVAKDVAKYGFMAYGVHEVSGLVSELVSGTASGIQINGDSNIVQGAQNKAGGNQELRSDYVTCASGECGEEEAPKQYYEGDKCLVSPGCSCDSFEKGLCE